MNSETRALIDAADAMTVDEIHDHPFAALDKLRGLTRELRAALEASAVSTPPTITDARIAAIEAVHPKHFTKPYGNGVGARVEGTENLTGQERYACGSCERHWPCPTIAALHPGGETEKPFVTLLDGRTMTREEVIAILPDDDEPAHPGGETNGRV